MNYKAAYEKQKELICNFENYLSNLSLISDNLNLFYAHDDRVGPYSRLRITKKFRKAGIIETAWWVDHIATK